MKIGIFKPNVDSDHNFRGVGNYFNQLIESLSKIKELQIQEFSDIKKLNEVDVVHFPFFDFFKMSLPFFKKYPTVITIHDVIPLLFPNFYPAGLKGKVAISYQKIALKNVDAIITDSNSSKKDIIKILNVPEKKIFPIYLAPSEKFRKIKDQEFLDVKRHKFNLPSTFVLYVGDINWNKNLVNIARAAKLANVDLVLVGKNFKQRNNLNHPELRSYQKFLDEFSNEPLIHFMDFLPTDDLNTVMNLAKATILTSFYEGFGLSILEAQACGTPVITSKVSSMPEIAGEGAILVNPNSIEEIAQAITTLVKNNHLFNLLIKKGFQNVKKFSWAKTAEETLEVYKYVVNN